MMLNEVSHFILSTGQGHVTEIHKRVPKGKSGMVLLPAIPNCHISRIMQYEQSHKNYKN